MSKRNQVIDSYIRRQRLRKALAFVTVMVLFVGLMSYALYMEYGYEF
jgi:succinate dehydrogenase hydrophobic anchor subunit